MLFDAVFDADSEYHIYFARKLTFDSRNLEIRARSFNLLPPISKKMIFAAREGNFEKRSI
jgi:hypothetical protein